MTRATGPTMDLAGRKRRLRRATVERILGLDPAVRAAEESALAERFPTLPGFERARCVLLYVSAFPEEIATGPLVRSALESGKRVVCPKVVRAERRLALFEVVDPGRDLAPGTLGIPEPGPGTRPAGPAEVDWVLVPGLAFDDRGRRLGRGAGHYDRLLPTLRPDAPRWALILEAQWVDAIPVEPHDVPLDGVASASKVVPGQSPRSSTSGGSA